MKKVSKLLYILAIIAMCFISFPRVEAKAISYDTNALYNGFHFGADNTGPKDIMEKDVGDMKMKKSSSNDGEFWNSIYRNYGQGLIIFSGVVALIFVALFIINITKFGASAANPEKRKQAISTLLWTGIASAIFGGVTLVAGISYGLFN